MGQEDFHASVQYGDMKGTAAADRHDRAAMADYLKAKELIKDEEYLIGIQMYFGEVHKPMQQKPVYVTALAAAGEGYETIKNAVDSGEPLKVRKISFEMELSEFFGLFKRFEICISSHGLIDGRDIQFDD